jgi:hypothetical protein
MAGQPSVRWLVIEWPQFIAINRESVHLRVIVDLSFLHRVDKSVPRVDRQIRRIAWSNSCTLVCEFTRVHIETVDINALGFAIDKGQFFSVRSNINGLRRHFRLL